ncbi:hypothetical protein LCGC14_2787230 [marine sediment metagenome]|uniref:Uncharacterized protein n=1 Tax=marine sediment metagenome TaxID=412755 RepID=A0A0F8YRM0_9ZZZZ
MGCSLEVQKAIVIDVLNGMSVSAAASKSSVKETSAQHYIHRWVYRATYRRLENMERSLTIYRANSETIVPLVEYEFDHAIKRMNVWGKVPRSSLGRLEEFARELGNKESHLTPEFVSANMTTNDLREGYGIGQKTIQAIENILSEFGLPLRHIPVYDERYVFENKNTETKKEEITKKLENGKRHLRLYEAEWLLSYLKEH